MSLSGSIEDSFKAAVRNAGQRLLADEKVSLTSITDSGVQAFIRATPLVRVSLTTDDITSENFSAVCNCAASKKGQLCKHVWATLLSLEIKSADFILTKKSIVKGNAPPDPEAEKKEAFKSAAKMKAAGYRKEQYEKQKAFAKKGKANAVEKARSYPEPVSAALEYFAENGFPLDQSLSVASVGEAKRKLSRVFHPDRGGSHNESVELNTNCEVLLEYLRS